MGVSTITVLVCFITYVSAFGFIRVGQPPLEKNDDPVVRISGVIIGPVSEGRDRPMPQPSSVPSLFNRLCKNMLKRHLQVFGNDSPLSDFMSGFVNIADFCGANGGKGPGQGFERRLPMPFGLAHQRMLDAMSNLAPPPMRQFGSSFPSIRISAIPIGNPRLIGTGDAPKPEKLPETINAVTEATEVPEKTDVDSEVCDLTESPELAAETAPKPQPTDNEDETADGQVAVNVKATNVEPEKIASLAPKYKKFKQLVQQTKLDVPKNEPTEVDQPDNLLEFDIDMAERTIDLDLGQKQPKKGPKLDEHDDPHAEPQEGHNNGNARRLSVSTVACAMTLTMGMRFALIGR